MDIIILGNDKTKGIKTERSLDSINIITVKFMKEKDKDGEKIKVLYLLNSTMILHINFSTKSIKSSDISMSLSKQVYMSLQSMKNHIILKAIWTSIFT